MGQGAGQAVAAPAPRGQSAPEADVETSSIETGVETSLYSTTFPWFPCRWAPNTIRFATPAFSVRCCRRDKPATSHRPAARRRSSIASLNQSSHLSCNQTALSDLFARLPSVVQYILERRFDGLPSSSASLDLIASCDGHRTAFSHKSARL